MDADADEGDDFLGVDDVDDVVVAVARRERTPDN